MTDSLLLDTNVIIYALQGAPPINQLLEQRKVYLSFITEIELFSWPAISDSDIKLIRNFISQGQIIEYSSQKKIKLLRFVKNINLKCQMRL